MGWVQSVEFGVQGLGFRVQGSRVLCGRQARGFSRVSGFTSKSPTDAASSTVPTRLTLGRAVPDTRGPENPESRASVVATARAPPAPPLNPERPPPPRLARLFFLLALADPSTILGVAMREDDARFPAEATVASAPRVAIVSALFSRQLLARPSNCAAATAHLLSLIF